MPRKGAFARQSADSRKQELENLEEERGNPSSHIENLSYDLPLGNKMEADTQVYENLRLYVENYP